MPFVVRSTLFMLCAFVFLASSTSAEDNQLQARHRAELINDVSSLLIEYYIFADVGEEMITLIKKKLKHGDYEPLTTVAALTDQITRDLQSISHDRHLHVSAAEAPPMNQAGTEVDEAAIQQRMLEQARFSNFGFERLEILPGNVGYVDLRSFFSASVAGQTAVAAMNFLANSSAIIFDLRNNGGGDPTMIQLLSSYLFKETQHLNSFYIRSTDTTEQYWTQTSVSGPKMVDIPVYILTSSRTFSAAEEFTYNLRNMKRATIVGETTGGGAHPVEFHFSDMGDGHYARMSVPYGRAINPITGTNWEGTGVEPHIKVSADSALHVAQIDILKNLIAEEENPQRQFSYRWAMEELENRLNPLQADSSSFEAYVGHFGPRKIFSRDGSLNYQRGQRAPLKLQAMTDKDRFLVGDMDSFRLQFERDESGEINGLTGQYSSGRTDHNERSKN